MLKRYRLILLAVALMVPYSGYARVRGMTWGHSALALAAVIAPSSPLLSEADKMLIAQLYDGQMRSDEVEIVIKADALFCTSSFKNLLLHKCTLDFSGTKVQLFGRQSRELEMMAKFAGIDVDATGNSNFFQRIECRLEPSKIAKRDGSGAVCTWVDK